MGDLSLTATQQQILIPLLPLLSDLSRSPTQQQILILLLPLHPGVN